jgi:hypothetical protein
VPNSADETLRKLGDLGVQKSCTGMAAIAAIVAKCCNFEVGSYSCPLTGFEVETDYS